MSVKTITNDFDQKTAEFLNELFLKYENSSESEKLDDFLARQLLDKKVTNSPDEAKNLINEFSTTLEDIEQDFQSLLTAKKEGKSRSQWLQSNLDGILQQFQDKDNNLINSIKTGLSSSNNSLIKSIFEEDSIISIPLKDSQYEDLNKKAIIEDFLTDIKNNTLLSIVSFDKEKGVAFNKNHKELKILQDYFNERMDSPLDINVKKVATTGVLIANKKGYIPFLKDKSIDEMAMIVDRGLTSAKIAYKIAKGEIDPINAVDYMIDRTTSTVKTAVTKVCRKAGGAIGSKVGGFVGSVFGPAGTVIGSKVGRIVGEVAGQAVGNCISKGIEKISTKAKEFVSNTWSSIKSATGNVFSLYKR
ncbi:hypothetical protein [Peribacillus sp. SCS-155]|uniref:hypothetical protein n=1 Tax=Peribacillus sedimenti TaxID=3115297 RepID=UPI0039063F24